MSALRHPMPLLMLSVALATITIDSAYAQRTGAITGSVESEAGETLAGVAIALPALGVGEVTRRDGTFILTGIRPGTYELQASSIGYRTVTRSIDVSPGDTLRVRLVLAVRAVELGGIEVSVLRPDLRPQSELEEREVREANPRDSGELLRKLPGSDAVRRGPVGLDPVVRGLRETEVGVYLDGTRIFPGGPARMDSPLSHLDPSALENMQVVKGPYALTWGAGNLSAIRVETRDVPPDAGPIGGELTVGYDWDSFTERAANRPSQQSGETSASFHGNAGDAFYWLHGVWREGNDYESGDGQLVPADFTSREVRGRLGYRLSRNSRVSVSAGYQDQGEIDYPGRLLDARFFETLNLSGRWELERGTGLVRSIEALAYVNDVNHEMDNDNKPTALPAEQRPRPGPPPFPLLVVVDADVTVTGGRLAATLRPDADWTLELGGDVYSARRNAVRTISRRDNGMDLFEDLMWPGARTTDAGVFLRAARPLGGIFSAGATARADFVEASGDTVSQFFRNNVGSDLDASEVNLSGALTVSVTASRRWSISLGVGTVVRTADATERYSDRVPASKAQTSAEFMGNPDLEPERSSQVDLWVEGRYPKVSLYLNAFGRRMDDYITITDTELPKRLPLSPDTVFQYINGEATFWGAEGSITYAAAPPLTVTLTASYLRGTDETLDEPALGVAPLHGSLSGRFEPPAGTYFVETTLHGTAEQDRVATKRGEGATAGYATVDLQGGVQVVRGVLLRAGVNNLLDKDYVNHLNARNPFSGAQIPEPGQVWFARLSYGF